MGNELQEEPRAGGANSLKNRLFESKVLWVLFLISLVWTISIFIVPLMIPPGTVADLEGSANRVDFQELWDTLPPYPKAVYYLGDAQCHQISSRTFYLNGNEMPVCARDVSIFLFITLGLFAGMLVKRNYYISAGLLSVFPKRFRDYVNRTIGAMWFTILFVILLVLPVGLDGGIQLLTEYESTNLVRILTGIPTGFIAGFLMAILVKSVKATREYALDGEPSQEITADSG
ncbi:MAG: DUF2085 domain-containing protein [Thermoplasmata archaeon]